MKTKVIKSDTITNILIAVIILGAVLRIFGLPDLLHFAGDEGRDLVIIQQIVSGQELPSLGPSASTGGFFLGPAFYYIVSIPAFFSSHPLAPALMVIALGVATIWLLYFTGRKIQSPELGLIAALLFATSYLATLHTRWSWNPNLLPFFVTLIILCVYEIRRRQPEDSKWWQAGGKYVVLLGLALGATLQFHATALLLLPALAISFGIWHPRVKNIWSWVAGAASFIIVMLPWIAHELTHDFANLRGVCSVLGQEKSVDLAARFTYVGQEIASFVNGIFFGDLLPSWVVLIFIGAVAAAFIWRLLLTKNKLNKGAYFLIIVITLAVVFYLAYFGQLWSHYLLIMLPPLILAVGLAFTGPWWQKKYLRLALIALVIVMSYCGIYTLLMHYMSLQSGTATGPFGVVLADQERVIDKIDHFVDSEVDLVFLTEDNFQESFDYLLAEKEIDDNPSAHFRAIVYRPVENPSLPEPEPGQKKLFEDKLGNLGLIVIYK